MLHRNLAVCLISMVLICACNRANPSNANELQSAQQTAQLKSTLAAEDFTADLDELVFYPAQSEPLPEAKPLTKSLLADKNLHGNVEDFTPSEAARLGVWEGSGFQPLHLTFTFQAVGQAYDRLGRIPKDAIEILEASNFFNEAGGEWYDNLSTEDRLLHFGKLIDPTTGRLFTDFQAEEGTPLGINIEAVPPAQWAEIGMEKTTFRGGLPPTHILHVRVFGDAPGRLLMERYFPIAIIKDTAEVEAAKQRHADWMVATGHDDPRDEVSGEPTDDNEDGMDHHHEHGSDPDHTH